MNVQNTIHIRQFGIRSSKTANDQRDFQDKDTRMDANYYTSSHRTPKQTYSFTLPIPYPSSTQALPKVMTAF